MRTRLAGACVATAAVVALAPAAASARPIVAHAAAKPKITMSGSTSVAPLAAKLIKAYIKKYPRRASFTLAQGGSDVGVADIAAGRVSIGNSSRDAKPSDPGGLHWYKIARDAICLATNKSNTLANLSQPQVQDIFSGKIRDWSDVPARPEPREPVVRERRPRLREHEGDHPRDQQQDGRRKRTEHSLGALVHGAS